MTHALFAILRTRILLIALILAPVAVFAAPRNRPGDIGVGVILGSPSGVSGKFWLGRSTAFDAALGFGDLSLHVDYLWHRWDLFPQPQEGETQTYFGLGARAEDADDDTEFGIRGVMGLAYWFPRHPVELFLEIVPVLEITPDPRLGVDAGVGVRFYFGKTK